MIEGKTKLIQPATEIGTIFMKTKNELTAGDAAKKATIEGIAAHKTSQTTNVFSLLQRQGIPTAFIEKSDATTLLCYDCQMLPVELVMRRYAFGSFLQREPQYQSTNGTPYRFENIRFEFFHKWTVVLPPTVSQAEHIPEEQARARYLQEGQWAKHIYTDPYIHSNQGRWELHPAKQPFEASKPIFSMTAPLTAEEEKYIQTQLMLPCFEALESAWSQVETQHGSVVLADMKIEIGRKKTDGSLVIADVIDNDSWRIWPGGDPKQQLDKQSFRDGDALQVVSDHYALVAQLTESFLA